jgi:hypothetical protein
MAQPHGPFTASSCSRPQRPRALASSLEFLPIILPVVSAAIRSTAEYLSGITMTRWRVPQGDSTKIQTTTQPRTEEHTRKETQSRFYGCVSLPCLDAIAKLTGQTMECGTHWSGNSLLDSPCETLAPLEPESLNWTGRLSRQPRALERVIDTRHYSGCYH